MDSADTKFALAWKDGMYKFKRADLSTILRALARTYDLTIHYQAGMTIPTIDGSFDLRKDLNTQVELLRTIIPNNIHINIDNRVLTVTSN